MRQLKPSLVVATAVFAAFSFFLAHAGGLDVRGGIGGASTEDDTDTFSGTTFDELKIPARSGSLWCTSPEPALTTRQ